MSLPSSRKEAIEAGQRHYYTGKPCKRGYLSLRHIVGTCLECGKERQRVRMADPQYRRQHTDREIARYAALTDEERASLAVRRASYDRWYDVKKKAKADKVRNQRPEVKAAAKARRRTPEGLQRVKRYSGARYQRLRLATPAWLTDEDREAIRHMYMQAGRLTRETGIEHHVDHVYPLRGKTISGLHVPGNLQILTAKDNLEKGNSVGM